MVIPREGDVVRLYIQLAEADLVDPGTGRVDKARMSPGKLLEAARKSFYPYKLGEPDEFQWWTIYIIGQRVASKFSVHERVFIAGDACHTHSPKAGQGMNASMNDTHNLAWKLVHVLRGWADTSLLKTYEHERRKYAQDLIDFDKEFSALFSGKPRTEENLDGVSHEQFLNAFQTFGAFTSGIGVHYLPSAITNITYQATASHQSTARNPTQCNGLIVGTPVTQGLTIGQRMPPQVFVRAADARPYEIQDLLPVDMRWKVLLFVGSVDQMTLQQGELEALAREMGKPGGFLRKYGRLGDGNTNANGHNGVFDILTIAAGKIDDVNFLDVPALFRAHWSKVLVDDTDVTGRLGGGAYERFGLDKHGVTIVVVRPDGYVGMVAPAMQLGDVDAYFAGFMRPCRSVA
ncbi:FAD binding domain-containing protein [Hygrophoropsis aurantiaca]|uniref:FAD binding domain-containing protein n=1 Tax=Hygrophoropsis aurantiaca TaxID=72124 RepID=A0ACB8AMH7_9AGAM|nr:FAD binding domain-containing protein [Hygrophoropsis aurantiaca]